jgi:hypothetical protein
MVSDSSSFQQFLAQINMHSKIAAVHYQRGDLDSATTEQRISVAMFNFVHTTPLLQKPIDFTLIIDYLEKFAIMKERLADAMDQSLFGMDQTRYRDALTLQQKIYRYKSRTWGDLYFKQGRSCKSTDIDPHHIVQLYQQAFFYSVSSHLKVPTLYALTLQLKTTKKDQKERINKFQEMLRLIPDDQPYLRGIIQTKFALVQGAKEDSSAGESSGDEDTDASETSASAMQTIVPIFPEDNGKRVYLIYIVLVNADPCSF